MEEQQFFDHDGVKVTSARFICDANTYAVRNITSTAAWTQPRKWLGVIVCTLLALACIKDAIGGAVMFALLAGLFYHLGKPVHFVKLNTSGGEVKAVKSYDLSFVQQIIEALNKAMISQHKNPN